MDQSAVDMYFNGGDESAKEQVIAGIREAFAIDEIFTAAEMKKYCDEISPEDVFSEDKLQQWAIDNDWIPV